MVVNRTPVHRTLTVALVLVYVAAVVALQALFSVLTEQESQLAVIVSTLVMAALLNPVRRRIQLLIDRRFHRLDLARRYPA